MESEEDIENIRNFKKLQKVKVDEKARKHILDGDGPNDGGGHRYGTNKSGKSEFPQSWNDDKIINSINEIIVSNKSGKVLQGNGRIKISGERESIKIDVIYDPKEDRIITAFPTNTVKNP